MPRALFCRKAAGYLAILLFALFANCGFLMAQNGARSVDSKLVLYNGLDCFYNNDFVCAKAKFYEYMKLEPSDSVGNVRAVLNYYFCLRQEQKVDVPKIVDEDFRAEVFRLIKEGYDKAESQKKGKSGKDLGFYLAVQSELDSVKGLFEYGNGLPGAKESFKKAVDEVVESSRLGSVYGTYLLGLMHYEVGSRVFYERWALDIIAGLRFQKKKGIEMIFSAQPNFPKEFAADVLGSIFQIIALENRKDIEKYLTPEIIKGLHEFTVEYPKNSNVRKYSFPFISNISKKHK